MPLNYFHKLSHDITNEVIFNIYVRYICKEEKVKYK